VSAHRFHAKEMKTALSSWGMRDFNLEKQVDAIIIGSFHELPDDK
jgi:hypothetical protein